MIYRQFLRFSISALFEPNNQVEAEKDRIININLTLSTFQWLIRQTQIQVICRTYNLCFTPKFPVETLHLHGRTHPTPWTTNVMEDFSTSLSLLFNLLVHGKLASLKIEDFEKLFAEIMQIRYRHNSWLIDHESLVYRTFGQILNWTATGDLPEAHKIIYGINTVQNLSIEV